MKIIITSSRGKIRRPLEKITTEVDAARTLLEISNSRKLTSFSERN